ncbi:hypothetical protein BV20DRAFT_1051584 [Pilatotrama ljubarskyi]|nr:hypothetical protein BV20DRAFT_1051584 [Pilatotrama ljubarskyi]
MSGAAPLRFIFHSSLATLPYERALPPEVPLHTPSTPPPSTALNSLPASASLSSSTTVVPSQHPVPSTTSTPAVVPPVLTTPTTTVTPTAHPTTPTAHPTTPIAPPGLDVSTAPSVPTTQSTASPSVIITYGPSARTVALPAAPTKRRQAPKIPAAQRAAMTKASRTKQAELQEVMDKWFEDTKELANQLLERFGRRPDHYLNQLFSRGAQAPKDRKPNAYNAWSHSLVKEVNVDSEPGSARCLMDIQRERIDEYHALTAEEKEKLMAELGDDRTSRKFGQRLTQRGSAADWSHCCDEFVKLAIGLKHRAGVEVMVLMVRNNTEFQTRPWWFFTDARLEPFMRASFRGWDCEQIAAKMEAFAVAGCDFANLHQSAKARADYLKSEMHEKIRTMLCTITGNPNAVMNYASHESEIVLHYGVELVGWTHPSWTNPSALSTSLPALRELLDTITRGSCYFRHLPAAELKSRQKTYDDKVKRGEIAPKKTRSDLGKTHAKRPKNNSEEGEDTRSIALGEGMDENEVEEDEEDEDEDNDNEQEVVAERAAASLVLRKRARTSREATGEDGEAPEPAAKRSKPNGQKASKKSRAGAARGKNRAAADAGDGEDNGQPAVPSRKHGGKKTAPSTSADSEPAPPARKHGSKKTASAKASDGQANGEPSAPARKRGGRKTAPIAADSTA